MAKKKNVVVLPPSHLTALSLLNETTLTIKEIAEKSGLEYESLVRLYLGKDKKDPVVVLFQSELKKIDETIRDRIRRLTAENKLIVLEELNMLLRQLRKSGNRDERVLVPILNALAKASAGIEINTQINNNTYNTMTTQELVLEFRRLTAITRSA